MFPDNLKDQQSTGFSILFTSLQLAYMMIHAIWQSIVAFLIFLDQPAQHYLGLKYGTYGEQDL